MSAIGNSSATEPATRTGELSISADSDASYDKCEGISIESSCIFGAFGSEVGSTRAECGIWDPLDGFVVVDLWQGYIRQL